MKNTKKFSSVTLASMVFILILISSTVSVGAEQNTSFGPYAYITNSWDHTVSIIDTETDTVKATVPVGIYPVGVAINPTGTKVYVTNEGSNDVSVIDTANSTVTADVNVGFGPHGAAVNPDGTKVYVTNYGDNNVSVIDTSTNTVIASVNVGGNPQGVAVTPNGEKVYVANSWDSTVSLIDTATNTVAATIPVGDSPNGVIVNPEGTKIYVTTSGDRTISVIDTTTNTVTATINVGTWPYGIAVNPDGTKIYVANSFSNTVSVIDAATNNVIATVPVGNDPAGIEVNPEGTKVYVANTASNTISVIDTATNTVMTTINVGSKPICFGQFIGSIPEQAQLPVANFSSNVTIGNAPLSVQFTDLSENTAAWNWSFGDGSFSTEQNPTHTFSTAGTFNVSLTVSDGNGTDSKLSTITVLEENASITYNVVGIHYKCDSWSNEQYPLINLFEENYVPLTTSGSSIWQSHINKLSKLVLDSNEKYTLKNGEKLDLDQGYALEAKQIDVDGKKVWLEFTKDGQYVGDKVISADEDNSNWIYELDNIQGEYNVPVMKVHISQIFEGAIEPIVQIDGIWLIDYTNTRTLRVGDEFGEMTLTQIINGVDESNLGSLIFERPAFERPVYAYITNSGSNTVSVIDTDTNTITATVNVGRYPRGVAVNPARTKVYVTNVGSTTVSVIDTETNTVTATVNVENSPYGVTVNPDGTKVYVINKESSTVSVIDTATNNVTASVNVGYYPYGVAVNPAGTKVYVTNSGSNNVSVINTATDTVTATVNVGSHPYGIAVTPDGTKAYVANWNSNTISVIDTATDTVTGTVNIGHYPYGVAINPEGTKVYMTNWNGESLSVIDTSTNTVTATVPVGINPSGVAVNPEGTKAYVANTGSNTVSVIDIATDTVTATVPVGINPVAFGQFISTLPALELALPMANFNSNVTQGSVPLSVQFTDLSENATEWSWSFGDGETSTEQNPTHTYSTVGTFNVSLTVSDGKGTDSKLATITVLEKNESIIYNVVGVHYKCDSWSNEQYPLINLFEEDYVPLLANGDPIWQSHVNKLAKLVLDSNEKYTLKNGEKLDLGSGYALEAKQIDVDGKKVWLEFTKDGQYVDDQIVATDSGDHTWTLDLDKIQGEDNINVLKVHVNQVFQGADDSIAQIDGVWIIDYANAKTLEVGDKFGEATLTQIINGVDESNLGSLIFERPAFESPIYAYITNSGSNTVSVIDTATNTITATVNVGSSPEGVAVNPARTKVYVTNRWDSTVSVIDTATNTVMDTINVGSYPWGIAVNPEGTKAYVANLGSSTVSVIDTATNTVTETVPAGYGVCGVAVNPEGTNVYVTNQWGSTVSVIDTAMDVVTDTLNVGYSPNGVAVNPDGKKVYVVNTGSNTVSVIDTATNIVTDTVNVGGVPCEVAINPDGTKVYVTNEGSNTISVIDSATNIVKDTVNTGYSPHGIAVNPEGTKVYVANRDSNTVSVIDTATNTVTDTVDVGSGPSAFGQFIGLIPAQSLLPVANFNSNVTKGKVPLSVQFTDLSKNATEWNWNFGDGNASTEQNPTHTFSDVGTFIVNLTVSNENGQSTKTRTISAINSSSTALYAYITNSGSNTVSIIDTVTDTVTDTVNVGSYPWGVAVNPMGTKVYVTNNNDNTVSVIDTATNTVIYTINVGGYSPYGVAVNPDGTKVYVTNEGSNTVSVIDTATNTVTNKVNVGYSPKGVAVNPTGTKVYVTNNNDNTVSVIDTATNTVIDTVNVGYSPYGVAVNPDGTKVYVTNLNSNTVSVIDTATNTVTDTINVGSYPWGVAVNPTGTKVYVTNNNGNTVSVIDTATNTVIDTVNVGYSPYGVAVNPDGTKVYVTNLNSNTVSVIDTATDTVTDTVNVGYRPSAFGQFISPLPALEPASEPAFPVANFSSNVTTGNAPLSVQFTDLSENATEWNWNFGDGPSSIEQNPIHVYSTAGNYTVTLTVNNEAGSDVVTKQVYIIALKHEDTIIWGIAPLSLQFTDLSENATSWKWNFGDGTNSTEQNPEHTYNKAGQYAVTVTVNNAAGSNTATYTGYINVVNSLEPPIAAFSAYPTYGKLPLNVSFTDNSTGSPTSWKWYFGDGTNSTEQNPTHIYVKTGQYAVTLSVNNVAGSNSITKLNYISVGNSLKAPVTSFSVSVVP